MEIGGLVGGDMDGDVAGVSIGLVKWLYCCGCSQNDDFCEKHAEGSRDLSHE